VALDLGSHGPDPSQTQNPGARVDNSTKMSSTTIITFVATAHRAKHATHMAQICSLSVRQRPPHARPQHSHHCAMHRFLCWLARSTTPSCILFLGFGRPSRLEGTLSPLRHVANFRAIGLDLLLFMLHLFLSILLYIFSLFFVGL
jgi:hypothetical protein